MAGTVNVGGGSAVTNDNRTPWHVSVAAVIQTAIQSFFGWLSQPAVVIALLILILLVLGLASTDKIIAGLRALRGE